MRIIPSRLTKTQAILLWTGLGLVASGMFHVAVWLAHGAPPLTGPVGWRKPIAFGLSTGVLSLSLAWVHGFLPQTRRLLHQTVLYALLITLEVGLITMQQWRGVASHFNATTPIDSAIFSVMGLLIVIVAFLIAIWTRHVFRPLPTTAANAFAARTGLVFLNLGNLLGVFIAVWGSRQLEGGLEPNIFGAAGQLKLPHAVALHAIQVLPLAALLASSLPRFNALTLVRSVAVTYAAVFVFTVWQTFSGRAPLDVTFPDSQKTVGLVVSRDRLTGKA